MISVLTSKKHFLLFLAFLLCLGSPLNAVDREGLPNVSTRTVIDRESWDVFGSALVWFASEETSTAWANHFILKTLDKATFDAKGLDFEWNTGFRAGAGYHFEYDQWDTQLYWTSYRTEGSSRIPQNKHTFLLLTEFFAGFINGDLAYKGNIHWDLLYNMIDWELGRSFWVSKGLSLRPYIGIKGGWINQTVHSRWHDIFLFILYQSKEKTTNDFWGVGPSGGVNCKWNLGNSRTRFFSLFGNFSTATMWGNWSSKDKYTNTIPQKINVKIKDSQLGSLMLGGILGIGWETDFNKGKSHFTTQLGYEMQIWFNQLRLVTFQQIRLHGDLTLQGVTLNCGFDF